MDAQRLEQELKRNPMLLQRVMNSRDGQTLLNRLKGDGFQQAVRSAAAGNPDELSRRIQQITRAPDGVELLERIREALET